MLIEIYENIINEDGSRTEGRAVVEVRCKGDGTPGEITYLETCNAIFQNKRNTHFKRLILDEMDKSLLESLLNKSFFIPVERKVDSNGAVRIEGVDIPAWTREAMKFIMKYKIQHVCFQKLCGRIIEL